MNGTGTRLNVFDAAQYLIEPADHFTANVVTKLRDRVPRVVATGAGEAWSFEDGAWLRPIGLEAQAGRSPIDLTAEPLAYRELRTGLYDASAPAWSIWIPMKSTQQQSIRRTRRNSVS